MQITLTLKMEAEFASETLATLSTSVHYEDPRAESTSTVNRCESVKSPSVELCDSFVTLPKLDGRQKRM
jgi:hypothetical protein